MNSPVRFGWRLTKSTSRVLLGLAAASAPWAPALAATAPPAPADVAAPPAEAKRLPDGLAYRILSPGIGTEHPGRDDKATVDYTGWTTDGNMFDSSITRGQPATFPVGAVIAGWTEMLQLMVAGEKVRVWIPESLAYQGRKGPPAGMLVFEISLISITKVPRAPPTPPDVAAPPKDAIRTGSGLAYKVLVAGRGTARPGPTSTVKVDYTGWTTDGAMFDSSITRGEPAVFPLNAVIAGWTEGVQLMTEGERARFWIPESLAYKGMKGPPAGMLVFDIELISIESSAAH